MSRRPSPRHLGFLALLLGLATPTLSARAPDPSVLVVTDVSPDSSFGSPSFGVTHGVTSGRVNGIAADPAVDAVLYAASEWAGVWKSTDGANSWTQTSYGLRSGATAKGAGPVLAVEAYSQRLLYITQSKDGRPSKPCSITDYQCGYFGGLWVSSDAAASWQHVEPPGCADPTRPEFSGVGFSGGLAFALADTPGCRLTASADPKAASWTNLPDPPFPASGDLFSPAAGQTPVLFACQGGFVWRTTEPDVPGSWVALAIPYPGYVPNCDGIASVPSSATDPPGPGGAPVPANTVVVSTSNVFGPASNRSLRRDFFVANFELGVVSSLGGFTTGRFGSGIQNVFVAPYASPGNERGPAISFDVYASDRWSFWKYDANGAWTVIPGEIHVDTWSMAFPASYDPPHGHCLGYASNDGGVWSGCGDQSEWLLASAGLSVLWPNVMAGFSRPIDSTCLARHPDGRPCPVLYLPTTDNDQWVSDSGGTSVLGASWDYLGDNLGDAGETLIDPAVPNMALAFRGPPNYHLEVSPDANPPESFSSYQEIVFPDAFIGLQDGVQGGITEVMTLPNHGFGWDDFFSLRGGPPQLGGAEPADSVMRNESAGESGGPGQWDLVTSGSPAFGPGMIGALRSSGGHDAPTLYVLTTTTASYSGSHYSPGQVYKGQFTAQSPTFTDHWLGASGYGFNSNLLNTAYSLDVNPYDPNELYATDLGDGSIRVSRDGGLSWIPDPTLRDVATNHGEFDFDCGNFPFNLFAYSRYGDKELFGNQCPVMQVVFVRDKPEVRVAVLYPGGVAFSRDSGHHWIPLHVTHEVAGEQPILLPSSAFYDPTPNADSSNPNTDLFVSLEGRGLERVEGPFATLESGRITDCPICRLPRGRRVVNVTAVVDSPGPQNVPMHPIGGGLYQGDFVFDSARTARVSYRVVTDGSPGPRTIQDLSPADVSSGVVALTSLAPARVSAEIAATDLDWIELRFRNDGAIRLATLELHGIEVVGPDGTVDIAEHDFLGSLDPGASVSLTLRVPSRGVLGVRPRVHAVDDAGRDVVFDGNATTVRRGR